MPTINFQELVVELDKLYLDMAYDEFTSKWKACYNALSADERLSLKRRLLLVWKAPKLVHELCN
jgi:hypothetical protein